MWPTTGCSTAPADLRSSTPAQLQSNLATACSLTGGAAGGGIEWGFARNWAARLEYLHLDLSDPTFSFTTTSGNGTTIMRSIDEGRLKIDTVRVGVSYLFN